MKEQQEKIRVLDPHIILILFISAFVFGIGILMIFLERKEIRTEGYEFIIFSVEILMLLLILYYMRTVVLSREEKAVRYPGCFGREIINGKSLLLSERMSGIHMVREGAYVIRGLYFPNMQ